MPLTFSFNLDTEAVRLFDEGIVYIHFDVLVFHMPLITLERRNGFAPLASVMELAALYS